VKIASADDFSADDRWDITRFWTDEELVTLGEKESAISPVDFIDEAREDLLEISGELETAKSELLALQQAPMSTAGLGDPKTFCVRSGTRIRGEDIRLNPGGIPVYSCFKNSSVVKGNISESWLKAKKIPIETKPLVTVNANGASVGKVYYRDEKCALTDGVIAVEIVRQDIDPEYLAVQLRSAVAAGGFLYEAKLFVGRVKELKVEIPVDSSGRFDLNQQRLIAAALKRFDGIRRRLHELGNWSGEARIS
jgi:hypothetical protein